ncbi:MAG: type II secretion system protein N [Pseudomonadota bacterium]
MKRWIFWILITLVLLVVYAPARALYWVQLPAGISLNQVSGSLWKGSAGQLKINQQWFYDVSWSLSPAQLLTGRVALQLDVPALENAIAGEGELIYSASGVELNGLKAQGQLAPVLALSDVAMPIKTRGNWQLTLNEYQLQLPIEQRWCEQLAGSAEGQNIEVLVNNQWLSLGEFPLQLGCSEQGAIELAMEGNNSLGLNFNGTIDSNDVSISGTVQPNPRTPEGLAEMFTYLGQADSQGRYRFSF